MAVSQFLHLLHIELLYIVLLSLDELAVLLTLTFEIGTQDLIVSYQIVNQMNLVAMRLEALQHEIAYASVLHAWMVSNS